MSGGEVTFNNITLTKKLPLKNKIIMYSGYKLPDGYLWCDGTNGTPDLKDKFIYGISSGNTGEYGDSNINFIPRHNHTINSKNIQKNHNINKTLNITFAPDDTGGSGAADVRRQNDNPKGNEVATVGHIHEINNANGTLITQQVEYGFNESNNNPNVVNGYPTLSFGNTNNYFNQKFIYIGFIIKDPSV